MTYQRRSSDIAVGEVRALLGRSRQSIPDLAAGTGISLSTLNRRLLGQAPFTMDELDSIAHHFNVPARDLLTPPRTAEAAS